MLIHGFVQIYLATLFMLFAIGPICLTIINFNILKGFKTGFIASMGTVVADICYIVAGSFFIDFLSKALSSFYLKFFSIGMAIFLFYIAYSFFRKKENSIQQIEGSKGYIMIFLKMFLLTISGPTTIFSYIAIFSSFVGKNFDTKLMITAASFATFSFYLCLNIILHFVRKKFSNKTILFLNKLSSLVISIFALIIIYKQF